MSRKVSTESALDGLFRRILFPILRPGGFWLWVLIREVLFEGAKEEVNSKPDEEVI
jgi:hypothetical protein